MAAPTILVVEDEPIIQQTVVQALEDEGYRVLATNDGDAVPLARTEHPDVLVLDFMMPGMTGAEVSRRLRDDPATAHIPIVAMSAAPDMAQEAGMIADVWLSKPFDTDTLCMTVAHCLSPLP